MKDARRRAEEIKKDIKMDANEALSNLNHDIRTPLNGISGLIYLMRNNLNDPKKIEAYLDKMEIMEERLKENLEDILQTPGIVQKEAAGRRQGTPDKEDLEGRTVLVAEDNEINREIVCEILTSWGCRIVPALDGLEAVQSFDASREGTFDFILMDIRMPYLNGYEAAAKIRGMGRKDSATVIIIALTANTYQTEIDKVKKAGMNGIITKPLHVNALYQLMSGLEKNK